MHYNFMPWVQVSPIEENSIPLAESNTANNTLQEIVPNIEEIHYSLTSYKYQH